MGKSCVKALFNDLGDQIEAFLNLRRKLLEFVATVGFGHIVLSQSLGHVQRVGERCDSICIYRLHLIDQGKNVRDSSGHFVFFCVADVKTRQLRTFSTSVLSNAMLGAPARAKMCLCRGEPDISRLPLALATRGC